MGPSERVKRLNRAVWSSDSWCFYMSFDAGVPYRGYRQSDESEMGKDVNRMELYVHVSAYVDAGLCRSLEQRTMRCHKRFWLSTCLSIPYRCNCQGKKRFRC